MTTYKINTPHFVAALVVSSGTIVQAAPVLHWTVGGSFDAVRSYCRSRGWVIEPLCEDTQPTWLECDGRAYELHWLNDRIVRITLHENGEERDITFDELPDQLRRVL